MKKSLPILLAVVLILSVVYVISPIKDKKTTVVVREKTAACIGNKSEGCKIGNCSGIKTCINGQWGGCIIQTVCTPGENKTCYSNACTTGYKICNECGTGYGECNF